MKVGKLEDKSSALILPRSTDFTVVDNLRVPTSQAVVNYVTSKVPYEGVAPYQGIPVKGDRWIEYDALDNYIREWVYNSSVWVATELEFHSFNSPTNILNSTLYSTNHTAVFGANNILISNLVVSGIVNAIPTSTNYWQIAVNHIRAPNILTNIVNVNLFSSITGITANNRFNAIASINTILDNSILNIKEFRLTESRPLGTLTKTLSYALQWRRVRQP